MRAGGLTCLPEANLEVKDHVVEFVLQLDVIGYCYPPHLVPLYSSPQ